MVQSIRKRNVDGHIIHINSIVGHFTPFHKEFDTFGIYGVTKIAVTATLSIVRQRKVKYQGHGEFLELIIELIVCQNYIFSL